MQKKIVEMMLDAPGHRVHRNDFLKEYLYSFRNRLSEMKLKGIIEYTHKNGWYTLTTQGKAMEFVYGKENVHEAGEKIRRGSAVTIGEDGKFYNLNKQKQFGFEFE